MKEVQRIVKECIQLKEYQQKQVISCLIANMLTDISDKEAKIIYNNAINSLKEIDKLK